MATEYLAAPDGDTKGAATDEFLFLWLDNMEKAETEDASPSNQSQSSSTINTTMAQINASLMDDLVASLSGLPKDVSRIVMIL